MAKNSISKSFTIKNVKNRIKELRYVKASDLNANPKNWRKHPVRQKSEMAKILNDIGFAGALVAREDMFGSLVLIDGHMRADMAPDENVPVLVLDVTEYEADRLLAMMDPIAAMAETDKKSYESLLDDLERADREAMKLLDDFNSKLDQEIAFNEEAYRREKEQDAVGSDDLEANEAAAQRLNIPVVKSSDDLFNDEGDGDGEPPRTHSLSGSGREGFLGVLRPGAIEKVERDPVLRLGRILSPVPRPVYDDLLSLLDESFPDEIKTGLTEVLTLGIEAVSKYRGDNFESGEGFASEEDVPF